MKEITDTNKIDYLNSLNEKASEFRGKIINHAIYIEMILSDTLAYYFCNDEEKKNLCFSIVFNNIELTFSAKIKILDTIFKINEPELKAKFPKLIDKLTNIRNCRNRIAHSLLDTTPEFIEKKYEDRIQLHFYGEGKKKQMVITNAEFKERMEKSSLTIKELISLQEEIIKTK